MNIRYEMKDIGCQKGRWISYQTNKYISYWIGRQKIVEKLLDRKIEKSR